jgi:hypothetical protein
MFNSSDRIAVAIKVADVEDVEEPLIEVTEDDDAPASHVSHDTIPVPPPSESHPGAFEAALDRGKDTIPTPPPESGVIENIVIPQLPPLDFDD